jgi:hypothetical protein
LKKAVQEYVRKCVTCAKTKPGRHLIYGKMEKHELPTYPFQFIGINWITKLPKSREALIGVVFNSVMIVMYRLTKFAYFIAWKEKSSAKELAS